MKIFFVVILFFCLNGCTGYTVASLTSNIATYSVTGKTNSDHAISYITGKDCKIFNLIEEKEICEESMVDIANAENRNENSIEEKKEEEKNIIIASMDAVKFGSLAWAEDQVKIGTRFADAAIEITENLSKKVEIAFKHYFY